MRILIINSVCGIRSTGRICTDLADRFIKEGHEVRIAYGRESVPAAHEPIAIRIGNDFHVYANALKARVLDNEGFNGASATKRFLAWADTYNPDLVWLHNLHGYYIHVGLLFDWIKSRPQMEVRWTLHDCWAFTGHCPHFSYVRCDQWKSQCFRCPEKKNYPKSFFLDNCKENYRRKKEAFCGVANMRIIVPSHWLAGLVKKSYLRGYPIEVVHNTIDKTVFKPTPSNFRERYGLENKKIVLGVATAWSQRKGLNDFVLLSEALGDEYRVVLVGVTEKQRKTLPGRILAMGCTNSAQELAAIYTAADVFVNLTYEDTYPTVNLEAQACGIPCITYRTGGSPESVSQENILDIADLKGIEQRIRQICSSSFTLEQGDSI